MDNNIRVDIIKKWLGTGSINIFGRPFAGKDTQGRLLATSLEGNLLGGGEIMRGSTIPNHIRSAMRTGKLIPSKDYVNIVLPYLAQSEFANKPLILSSVGRWHGEEQGVMDATKATDHPMRAVIYLDLDEDAVRNRWQATRQHTDRGNRHDDTKEILEIRLAEFRDKTMPVIEYYRDRGILITIDAHSEPSHIYHAIIDALYKISLV